MDANMTIRKVFINAKYLLKWLKVKTTVTLCDDIYF